MNIEFETDQIIDGRYKIIQKLDEGGMGAVWKASDSRTNDSMVVLKFPLKYNDPEILQRFATEAGTMRALAGDCDNILDIQDIGSVSISDIDNVPYYVMRFQTGGTLRDWQLPSDGSGDPVINAQSLDWVRGVATALDFLHHQQEPVFHRDVKPENILFNASGTPKLSDFGIVKNVTKATTNITQTGASMGTVAYMPPEIWRGEKFSAASDQFSFAATIYEKLCGNRPYDGGTPFAMLESLAKGHEILSEKIDLPAAASAALDRGLAHEPGKRYGTCMQLAEEFLKGLSAKETESRTPVRLKLESEDRTRELDLEEYRRRRKEPSGLHDKGQVSISVDPVSGEGRRFNKARSFLINSAVVGLLALGACAIGLMRRGGDDLPIAASASNNSVKQVATESPVDEPVSQVAKDVSNVVDAKEPEPEIKNRIGMQLRLISIGERRSDLETIAEDYYLGITEVTQSQWSTVMDSEPWKAESWGVQESDDSPATFVNLGDAQEFCTKLSSITGQTYRLPTENEWEFACRAGTETPYAFAGGVEKLGDYAWFDLNSELAGEAYAHNVALKKPNDFGLFDMHGNVWEWFEDASEAGVRGGGWIFDETSCRSDSRMLVLTKTRNYNIGFRVVREVSR